MSAWNEGYVNDIDYTYGYYTELNPNHFIVPFLMSGHEPPKVKVACELGFGQGLSVNIHSAAQDTKWYGTDFNPSQAQFAQNLVSISGADAHLVDESFEQFCSREDLPQFDYIALHGIWSWISNENQRILVDFIRRKLNVGGVLYISYNTLPGWSRYAPLRHLMIEHAKIMGTKAVASSEQVLNSLQFTKRVIESSHNLSQEVPNVLKRIDTIANQDASYLAHEYFNQYWQLMYFSEIANELDHAKLRFVAGGSYLEEYPASCFDENQINMLNELSETNLRETVKDFFLDRQFRKDYWVKGGKRLNGSQLVEAWDKLRILKARDLVGDHLEVQGRRGKASISATFYQPILDLLDDKNVHTVKSIRGKLPQLDASQLHEMLAILITLGTVIIAQDENVIAKTEKASQALNQHLFSENVTTQKIFYFASPVTGGGVLVTLVEQAFLLSCLEGKDDIDALAQRAWKHLQAGGKCLLKDGQSLQSEQENLDQLSILAKDFKEKTLPHLMNLKVIPA
ncbi:MULTISPECIES: methyltransferase regulatory domain-containing protein [unclassified Acinetobacter]|uniref:methyltransferase regulatory domain-containing protein n=1 Tax=unclassified Acinetobacter TaxID=196816 RepID=UPI0035B73714